MIAETQGVSATADQPTTTDGRERRDWWVAALRREGAAFATAAQAADPDDDVPTCPGWTVRRLVAHGYRGPVAVEVSGDRSLAELVRTG